MADIEKIMALADEYYDKDEGDKALPLCHQAAEAGSIDALRMIGNIYRHGKGVDIDTQAAVSWYKKAIAAGDNDSRFNLACVYDSGETGEPDFESAFRLFKECADAGDKEACFNVGYYYYYGQGVEQDYRKAFKWAEKGARAGYDDAQYMVGVMYERGEGVRKEHLTAIKWLKKAAEQGHEHAQELLSGHIKFTTVEQFLTDIADGEGVTIPPPASGEDLEKFQKELAKKGFPPIPDEYIDFLRKCDGFVLLIPPEPTATQIGFWSSPTFFLWSFQLFGTKPAPVSDPKRDDIRDDLITATERFIRFGRNDWMSHCLVIGEGWLEICFYTTRKRSIFGNGIMRSDCVTSTKPLKLC